MGILGGMTTRAWVMVLVLAPAVYGSNCCTAHATPGCTNATIQTCVCLGWPSCCTQVWNLECVTAVNLGCSAVPCPPSGCISTCGNDIVECLEQCDTGSALNDNGACTLACRNATCGDGLVWFGHEQCDNGTLNSDIVPDACRTDCKLAHCGDGVVDPGEECDGGVNSTCCVSCKFVVGQCSSACINASHASIGLCTTDVCSVSPPQYCSPFTCVGQTGCGTKCATDDDCWRGYYCSGTACVLPLSPMPADGFVSVPALPTSPQNVALATGLAVAFGVVGIAVISLTIWYFIRRRRHKGAGDLPDAAKKPAPTPPPPGRYSEKRRSGRRESVSWSSSSRRRRHQSSSRQPPEQQQKRHHHRRDDYSDADQRDGRRNSVSDRNNRRRGSAGPDDEGRNAPARIKRTEPRLVDSLPSDMPNMFSGTTEPDFDFTVSGTSW